MGKRSLNYEGRHREGGFFGGYKPYRPKVRRKRNPGLNGYLPRHAHSETQYPSNPSGRRFF